MLSYQRVNINFGMILLPTEAWSQCERTRGSKTPWHTAPGLSHGKVIVLCLYLFCNAHRVLKKTSKIIKRVSACSGRSISSMAHRESTGSGSKQTSLQISKSRRSDGPSQVHHIYHIISHHYQYFPFCHHIPELSYNYHLIYIYIHNQSCVHINVYPHILVTCQIGNQHQYHKVKWLPVSEISGRILQV